MNAVLEVLLLMVVLIVGMAYVEHTHSNSTKEDADE